MRIAMIGGGYVGLVSGACSAEFGSEVAVVEVDPVKRKGLRSGQMAFAAALTSLNTTSLAVVPTR